MNKWKNLFYYLFCIIFLSFFPDYQPIAMELVVGLDEDNPTSTTSKTYSSSEEESDTSDSERTPSSSFSDNEGDDDDGNDEEDLSQNEESPPPQNTGIFKRFKSITKATRDHFPWTWRETTTGMVAGTLAAAAGLPLSASFNLGNRYYDVIPIPSAENWGYYGMMVVVGGPPCAAIFGAVYGGVPTIVKTLRKGGNAVRRGASSAWKAAACCWNKEEDSDEEDSDVDDSLEQHKPKNKQACYTVQWAEFKNTWLSLSLKPKIYSWPTAGLVIVFYGGYFACYFMDMEVHTFGSNTTLGEIWGGTFAGLSTAFVGGTVVYASRKSNEHPCRQLDDDTQELSEMAEQMRDITRNSRGPFHREALPDNLKQLDSNWRAIMEANTLKEVMQEIIEAAGSPPYKGSCPDMANFFSTWSSLGLQAYNTCFMKPLILYYLLCRSNWVSKEDLELASGITTGFLFPLLSLISARVIPLTQKEIYQWLHWGLKPEGSPGFWGERLPNSIAEVYSFFIVGLSTAFYLKREVLDLPYLRDYPAIQYGLIWPCVLFDIMPPFSLFLGKQFNAFGHWIAGGASMRGNRFTCCYDTNKRSIMKPLSFSCLTHFEDLEIALRLMRRLGVAKRKLNKSDRDLQIWGNKRLAWGGYEGASLGENTSLMEHQNI